MLRSISSKRARAQFRGWPLSEKVLVILECKEAFKSTELPLLNDQTQPPGRGESRILWKAEIAAPVGCSDLFGLAAPLQ
jgi:hypothetical protein